MEPVQVYLSRRNLLTLLSKLDKAARGEDTQKTIVKRDMDHPEYPATHNWITVTAVEDEVYYADRLPGPMVEDSP